MWMNRACGNIWASTRHAVGVLRRFEHQAPRAAKEQELQELAEAGLPLGEFARRQVVEVDVFGVLGTGGAGTRP